MSILGIVCSSMLYIVLGTLGYDPQSIEVEVGNDANVLQPCAEEDNPDYHNRGALKLICSRPVNGSLVKITVNANQEYLNFHDVQIIGRVQGIEAATLLSMSFGSNLNLRVLLPCCDFSDSFLIREQ